jgi:acyl-CoA synthetase (AMP-forming)/AMP-acid ligase II
LPPPAQRSRACRDGRNEGVAIVALLHALLQASVRRFPERPALAWGQVAWTYRDLDEAAGRLANRIAESVTPGQRIGILASNTPVLAAGMFAAWRLGAVAVPLNARLR